MPGYDSVPATQLWAGQTGGAAGTTGTNLLQRSQHARYVRWAQWRVVTAGTAAGCVIVLRNGTTALTTMTMGTNTAGVTGTATFTGTGGAVDAGADLNFMMSGDATGVANVACEGYYSAGATFPPAPGAG